MGLDISLYKQAKFKGNPNEQNWTEWKEEGYFRKVWVMLHYFDYENRIKENGGPLIELNKKEVKNFYRDLKYIFLHHKAPGRSEFDWREYIGEEYLDWQIEELIKTFHYLLSDWDARKERVFLYASY